MDQRPRTIDKGQWNERVRPFGVGSSDISATSELDMGVFPLHFVIL